MNETVTLFAGSSHPELAKQIAEHLHIDLGKIALSTFPDGEISVEILENVRGKSIFILQSIAHKPSFYLMELLIIIDALKRASAKEIIAVIPYFGYSRQDRKDKPRVPITAKLVANLIEKSGATRVLTMDLHAGQIQGFFDIPVDNLFGRPPFLSAIQQLCSNNLAVVAPDVGSIKFARAFATALHVDMAVVDKRRLSPTQVLGGGLIGDVKDKDIIIADDLCSTGGTLVLAAMLCKSLGARRIIAIVTHGLFVEGALEKLDQSPIEHLLVSNSVPSHPQGYVCQQLKVQVVSVAELFSEAIKCVVSAKSISSLFFGP